jgi:hypothetical protein
MTAFTVISNALVAVGAKPFATTIQALRDNLAAAFEGDAVAVAAGVTLRLGALQRLVAGDTIRFRDDTTRSTTATSFANSASVGIVQSGQIRVTLEHRAVAGTSEARIVRLRAGISTTVGGTWSTGTTFTARSVDIDVQPGDQISFQHRHTVGSSSTEIRNCRISTDTSTRMFPADNFGQWDNMV